MSRLVYLFADRGIGPDKRTGAVAHFRAVTRALADLGHDVVVVSSIEPPSDAAVTFEPLPDRELVGRIVSMTGDTDGRSAPSARRTALAIGHVLNNTSVDEALRRIVPRFRPDAILERYVPFGIAGVHTSAALGVPHTLNVHAPLAWEGRVYRHQPLADAADFLEAQAFAAATRIVVNSAELATILSEIGVAERKLVVIPNGVDTALFAPTGPHHRDRLPRGAVVVGFSGSLKVWHGVDVLLDAFERLAPAHSNLHLLVVGDGPMRTAVSKAGTRLPGRITTIGAVPAEAVPAWVRTMDIAVSPYPLLERFYFSPLKTLEYMAAARATVSSRIGQLRDLVDDGKTGLLVAPGDPEALASAILMLVRDAGHRRRLGAAASEVAARSHRWSDRVAELVDAALFQVPSERRIAQERTTDPVLQPR